MSGGGESTTPLDWSRICPAPIAPLNAHTHTTRTHARMRTQAHKKGGREGGREEECVWSVHERVPNVRHGPHRILPPAAFPEHRPAGGRPAYPTGNGV